MTTPAWRVVAVDDEPPALLALSQALRAVSDFALVGSTTDPARAADLVRSSQADAVFLDIQMPGLSGFEVVQQLAPPLPLIVFVTAYHEFAVRAFETHAVDYLLKPIEPQRFAQMLASVRTRLQERRAAALTPHLQALVREFTQAGVPAEPATAARISIRVDGRTLLLDPTGIDRVVSDNNTVTWFVGRERHRSRQTLAQVEALLPAPQFVRVHRSAIVNVARVRAVEPYVHGEYVLHLTDGSRVLTGRTYHDVVRARFGLTGQ